MVARTLSRDKETVLVGTDPGGCGQLNATWTVSLIIVVFDGIIVSLDGNSKASYMP